MTVSRKTKQDVVWEFRCAEILGAARKVFAKKGFAKATMDEIAAATGLAKGTLYLYFKSKRDVYLKTLRHGSAELLELAEANMQGVAGVRAKIRALIETRVRYADQNRDFFKIYLTEFNGIARPAAINKEFRDLHFKQARAIEQALRDGAQSGEIQQLDFEAAAFIIQDMARSLIMRRVLGWSKNDVEQDIDFLCGFIYRAIGC
jgi:AcrR family transcriptional regulator